jgi:thiol:disulfide interchange protein
MALSSSSSSRIQTSFYTWRARQRGEIGVRYCPAAKVDQRGRDMRLRVWAAAAIGLVVVLTAGCTSAPYEPPAATQKAVHYDPDRDPSDDLDAALALSATDGKEVLVDFGADWCPDCRVLDELFQSPKTKPVLEQNYHVVTVDVGQFDNNIDFSEDYVDLSRSGIPALVVLTPAGKIREATNDGSFSQARNMDNAEVNAFLTKWAAKS